MKGFQYKIFPKTEHSETVLAAADLAYQSDGKFCLGVGMDRGSDEQLEMSIR